MQRPQFVAYMLTVSHLDIFPVQTEIAILILATVGILSAGGLVVLMMY